MEGLFIPPSTERVFLLDLHLLNELFVFQLFGGAFHLFNKLLFVHPIELFEVVRRTNHAASDVPPLF